MSEWLMRSPIAGSYNGPKSSGTLSSPAEPPSPQTMPPPPPPPACEDNVPEDFGPFWCKTNSNDATFCNSAHGQETCKKTCSLYN